MYIDVVLNPQDGRIIQMTITESGKYVILNRDEIAQLIRRINSQLEFVKGEFRLK